MEARGVEHRAGKRHPARYYAWMSDTGAASRLCTACGLCCSGVLFDLVRLQPEDSVQKLLRLGMKIRRKTTRPWFPQPCQFLQGCSCTIYGDRPSRCRLFSCQQLRAVEQGSTTEEEAAAMIALARRMVAEVEERLPPVPADTQPPTLEERVNAALAEQPDPDLARLHKQLKRLLDREFRILG